MEHEDLEQLREFATEIAKLITPAFDHIAETHPQCKLDLVIRLPDGTFILTGGRETMNLEDLIADLQEYAEGPQEATPILDIDEPTEH